MNDLKENQNQTQIQFKLISYKVLSQISNSTKILNCEEIKNLPFFLDLLKEEKNPVYLLNVRAPDLEILKAKNYPLKIVVLVAPEDELAKKYFSLLPERTNTKKTYIRDPILREWYYENLKKGRISVKYEKLCNLVNYQKDIYNNFYL